jgi:2'-5' RNA ligase
MPGEASESAIVVRVAVPAAIDRLRRRWDRAAGLAVPAHVTIVYPFMPPKALDRGVRRALAEVAADHEPFDVRFTSLGRFPGLVYAAPDPSAPFARLTEGVVARFPDFPPYGGAFDEIIPHLTIAESTEAPLDDVATEAAAALPFGHRVSRLAVLVQGPDDRWHSLWRLRLGGGRA